MSRKDWPLAAWDAINRLAEMDMAHYPKHIHNREAFLGKARTERVRQHEGTIDALLYEDPFVTSERIVAVCNPAPAEQKPQGDPEWARRRDYDRERPFFVESIPECGTCNTTGFTEEGGFCDCQRGVGRRWLASMKAGREVPTRNRAKESA